ncbi:glycoside hydrolase family 127 protein [Paucibacter sp. hw1]|uniref:Glycoside hydrolase family 127 protein n=2 Tax=Roseateles koreensis TaxID=2987526 RepID=A0ABT5KU77_9BURK|nr:glycoside hydrolase family 127 protein [Roseateles koreensis]MDC8786489.1 glycoside hydrolase family 127 protein [Roseateles koreensis]
MATTADIKPPAQLFPAADVRLSPGPFFDAQTTDLHYLLALDPDRLAAPFLREAGLPVKSPSYGNWESTGLDGHMGGHYLSALALMVGATGDAEVRQRLNYFVAELRRAQIAHGNGYLGGIPDGDAAWAEVAKGQLKVDNFSVNGRWVPWYNLHKTFAGLRDAWLLTGNDEARRMLVALSDWALRLTRNLSDAQWQDMLRSEHGGMNEVLTDVAQITGDAQYLQLAQKFSHHALLQPLIEQRDELTGLHANTQIPKVIGFKRVADLSGDADWLRAARFFWQTVHDHRTVAIGGNSVREHFHDAGNFQPMLDEVEGPETCNTYNMLKLTQLLFLSESTGARQAQYGDYYERALYNHILASQRPGTGGFAYFTPMRPNHYRVYSQVDQGMWCCVGSGLESQAKYGEFIYTHDEDSVSVNLFIASTLHWRERHLHLTQSTRFPDEGRSRITLQEAQNHFGLRIRYPAWVAPGQLRIKINGRAFAVKTRPGDYVEIRRNWAAGDQVDIELPMRTQLEQMPGMANTYAVLHGPIVLAAKTEGFVGEHLKVLADDSRMGHIAQGPVYPQEAAPLFVSDTRHFIKYFKPVAGEPLTFTAPGLIRGKNAVKLRLIPFFRLHDSRYMIYWAHSTPAELPALQAATARAEHDRLALDAQTIDQVAPGEQQPESDHFFKGEGVESGINKSARWRHARGWFSYELSDPTRQAKALRLSFSTLDAGRRFKLFINGQWLSTIELKAPAGDEIYALDYEIPPELVENSQGKLQVKFVAEPDSIAGGLYGLRLLK